MLPTEASCDDCVPDYVRSQSSGALLSVLPFLSTFLLVAAISLRKFYPLLSPASVDPSRVNGFQVSANATWRNGSRASAFAFSATIALSAVLTELLLCEISNSFQPSTRKIVLHATITSLLFLLLVVIPILEICSVVVGLGLGPAGGSRVRARTAWVLGLAGYFVFLTGFWFLGAMLPKHSQETGTGRSGLIISCLERLGITGTLMLGLLSGFAAVSAIWQTFLARAPHVTDADINRKKTGLSATLDMLRDKESCLDQLRAEVADSPTPGLLQKAIGSIRGNGNLQQLKGLELEISGLNAMSASLEASLATLQSRRATQLRSSTRLGRLINGASFIFACYCVYRIGSALISIIRRQLLPDDTFTSTDPITYALAFFGRHVNPSLDQAAWAHQVSLLLSGVILLASFNAAIQTFQLLVRFSPRLLHAARSNVALFISQLAALYVISSALMLRGMMPEEVGGVINDALGTSTLQPAWTERWFEGWFVASVLGTTVGIWLSQKINGNGVWDDDGWDTDIELGKQC